MWFTRENKLKTDSDDWPLTQLGDHPSLRAKHQYQHWELLLLVVQLFDEHTKHWIFVCSYAVMILQHLSFVFIACASVVQQPRSLACMNYTIARLDDHCVRSLRFGWRKKTQNIASKDVGNATIQLQRTLKNKILHMPDIKECTDTVILVCRDMNGTTGETGAADNSRVPPRV